MDLLEITQITTTFSTAEEAHLLVVDLLERRLIACGQIDANVQSCYRWQGAVARDTEWRCTLKTSRATTDACLQRILEVHPYDTPELIVASVSTSEAYAAWVDTSVAPEPN
ncbi:MAG: divalent-cation tolerance protein CutA [Pirellulales bacterium]|jgi:periplasmic divalent cation tolerance protein|nr:divalent-cation tolerance protein CutA [Pirellulales bacterium]